MQRIYTIDDIKAANRAAGQHWFSYSTMKFFDSRVESDAITSATDGRVFFVSSEQFDDESPRLYTIREAIDGGRSINTVGDFQGYATKSDAIAAILAI